MIPLSKGLYYVAVSPMFDLASGLGMVSRLFYFIQTVAFVCIMLVCSWSGFIGSSNLQMLGSHTVTVDSCYIIFYWYSMVMSIYYAFPSLTATVISNYCTYLKGIHHSFGMALIFRLLWCASGLKLYNLSQSNEMITHLGHAVNTTHNTETDLYFCTNNEHLDLG